VSQTPYSTPKHNIDARALPCRVDTCREDAHCLLKGARLIESSLVYRVKEEPSIASAGNPRLERDCGADLECAYEIGVNRLDADEEGGFTLGRQPFGLSLKFKGFARPGVGQDNGPIFLA
jgi:hypothetical protein